jgi:hypothetical protein
VLCYFLCCDTLILSLEKLAVLHPAPMSNLSSLNGWPWRLEARLLEATNSMFWFWNVQFVSCGVVQSGCLSIVCNP